MQCVQILTSCWDAFLDRLLIQRDPLDVSDERVECKETGVVSIKTTTRNKNTCKEKVTMQYVFGRRKITLRNEGPQTPNDTKPMQ